MKTVIVAAIALAIPGVALAEAKWQDKALKAVKTEKKVVDARWRMAEQNVLWVSMIPDGTPRNGFAEYLCIGLAQAAKDDRLKTVEIYDPVTYENGGKSMGMAVCR